MGPTACPKGSQVGKGSAAGMLGTANINLPVTAFNGGNGSKLNLYVGGIVSKTIEGTIAGGKGKPKTITFQVPNSVINPVGGTFSSLTKFGVTIKAAGEVGRQDRRLRHDQRLRRQGQRAHREGDLRDDRRVPPPPAEPEGGRPDAERRDDHPLHQVVSPTDDDPSSAALSTGRARGSRCPP